jgi:CRISPR-associated protein Csb2
LISVIGESERGVRPYMQPSARWATVTPVILPGWDDRRRGKAESLFRKAIVQAGFSKTLADHADIELRSVSHWPGGDIASRYFVPQHLRDYPRRHCQIAWRDPAGNPLAIPGPVVIGGGRYCGVGVFAAMQD